MSIRKINRKRLSRNVRLKHAPLKVLPLISKAGLRHGVPKHQRNAGKQEARASIQCSAKTVECESAWLQKKPSRNKLPLTFHPVVTARLKRSVFRWTVVAALVVLAVVAFFIMVQDGFGSMKNIIIYGVMGFFTFFMGYCGTIFAKDVLEMVIERKNSHNEVDAET